jgi:F-type H+-transporting ATPase subunit c
MRNRDRHCRLRGKIQVIMIIGLAMIESLCIYALLVSLGILINMKMFF